MTFNDFRYVFNSNNKIGHDVSLNKSKIPMTVDRHGNRIYISFACDNSYIGVKLPIAAAYSLFGKSGFTFYNDKTFSMRLNNITFNIINKNGEVTIYFFSSSTVSGVALANDEMSLHSKKNIIDVECSIVESNKIAGLNGQFIGYLVESSYDLKSSTEERRQGVKLPVELHQFKQIRCRLLKHNSYEVIDYKYETTKGTPFIVVRIEPV